MLTKTPPERPARQSGVLQERLPLDTQRRGQVFKAGHISVTERSEGHMCVPWTSPIERFLSGVLHLILYLKVSGWSVLRLLCVRVCV